MRLDDLEDAHKEALLYISLIKATSDALVRVNDSHNTGPEMASILSLQVDFPIPREQAALLIQRKLDAAQELLQTIEQRIVDLTR